MPFFSQASSAKRVVQQLLATAVVLIALVPGPAQANCTSPALAAGSLQYLPGSFKYQYCDGTNWLDAPVSGTSGSCGSSGLMAYDGTLNDYKYCDGSNYHKIACALDAVCSGADWANAGLTSLTKSGTTQFTAGAFALSDTTLIIGDSGGATDYIYSVSNTGVTTYKSSISVTAVGTFGANAAVSGTLAIIGDPAANSNAGAFRIYDLTTPSSPVLKATVNNPGGGTNFGFVTATNGTYAAIAEFSGSTYLYDISTPTSPALKSTLSGGGYSALFYGSYLILGNGGTAASIYNISSPTSPSLTATINDPSGANDYFSFSMTLYGNVLAISNVDESPGNYAGAVYLYDISTPSSPVQVAHISSPISTYGYEFGNAVSLYGSFLVVGASAGGSSTDYGHVYIYDVSTPSAPTLKHTYADPQASQFSHFGERVATSQGNFVAIGATQVNTAYTVEATCLSYPCQTNGTCSVAGTLNYVAGSFFEHCNGTAWIPWATCVTPSLSFTNQTSVSLSTVTSSDIVVVPATVACDNTVSLTGSGSPQFRICSDSACASEVVTWGSSNQTVSPGQYLQMRLTSSASYNTATTASLTVGADSLPAWSVTTMLQPKYMFITSTTYNGSAVGSVATANTSCASRATAASLTGTWKAWLAVTTNTDDPNTTFTKSSGQYRTLDETVIASSFANLISGTLLAGISRNESNVAVAANTHIWTNVSATTAKATTSGSSSTGNCSAWTSASASPVKGRYGLSGSTTSAWSASSNEGCNIANRLLCVQQ